MRALLSLVAILLLALIPALPGSGAVALAQAAGEPPAYRVIVNPTNPATALDRAFVRDAFLKKATRWPDGTTIHPVDLVASSPVRRHFSDDVLNRSVEAVKSYWQQRIFSGRDVPPPEVDTDDEAIDYVGKHPGGLGYVSGSAKVDGVKVVGVR